MNEILSTPIGEKLHLDLKTYLPCPHAVQQERIRQREEAELPHNAYTRTNITMNRWRKPTIRALIRCTPATDGFATRAVRLVQACKGHYVRNRGGYILSLAAARRFENMYALGYDGTYFGGIIPPGG